MRGIIFFSRKSGVRQMRESEGKENYEKSNFASAFSFRSFFCDETSFVIKTTHTTPLPTVKLLESGSLGSRKSC